MHWCTCSQENICTCTSFVHILADPLTTLQFAHTTGFTVDSPASNCWDKRLQPKPKAGMQKVNTFSICSPPVYMAECKLVFYHTSSVLSVSHRWYQKWEWGVSGITRCRLQTSSAASRHVLDARKCEMLFWTWPEKLSWDWIQQVLAKWLNQSLAGLDRRRSQVL